MVLDATRRTYVDLSTNLTAKSLPRVLSIIVKISIDGDKCKSRWHRYKFSGSKSYTLLNFIIPLHRLKDKGNNSGCSSARLEYTSGGRVVAGSNPVTPTSSQRLTDVFIREPFPFLRICGPTCASDRRMTAKYNFSHRGRIRHAAIRAGACVGLFVSCFFIC